MTNTQKRPGRILVAMRLISQYLPAAIAAVGLLFSTLTILMDYTEAHFRGSGFYFAESLMFSICFWWLFVPVMYIQIAFMRNNVRVNMLFLVFIAPVILHIALYPLFVWGVSSLFYSHRFQYLQTLKFGLPEYLSQLLILYSLPVAIRWIQLRRENTVTNTSPVRSSVRSLTVNEGEKKMQIATDSVIYFSANPPYTTLHCEGKRYLYYGSLKTLSGQLDPDKFVRVHKSVIIQMAYTASYKSRLNGDYDATMKNGTVLRISRNYAADFKLIFHNSHRDTLK